jgi:hypothetical protein
VKNLPKTDAPPLIQPYRLIQLTQQQFAIVDENRCADLNRFQWCAVFAPDTNSFYAARGVPGPNGKTRTVKMHHYILKPRKGYEVDHINKNTLDNRLCNLREVSKRENAINRTLRSDNKSGVTGVHKNKKLNKWCVTVSTDNGEKSYQGLFTSLEEASEARLAAVKRHYGEYAPLRENLPSPPNIDGLRPEPRAPKQPGPPRTPRRNLQRNNTSGVTGVSKYTKGDRYVAGITVDKRWMPLGYFDSFDDAVKARRAAERKYYGFEI